MTNHPASSSSHDTDTLRPFDSAETTTSSPTSQTQTTALLQTESPKLTPSLSLKIVSVTSLVSPGANATLVAEASPGVECDIDVYYKSVASTASGLSPKIAGSDGKFSWTWKVGTRTTPGTRQIIVKASYSGATVSQSTDFVVR